MKFTKTRAGLIGAAVVTTAVVAGTATGSATADGGDRHSYGGTTVAGQLNPLNNSGVTGRSETRVQHRRIHVEVDARGLAAGLPHAQHIHFGAKARHECPTIADDSNGDFRLTTVEGAPAYGPVRVSLTTKGDTSAGSVLAVDRFPTVRRARCTTCGAPAPRKRWLGGSAAGTPSW